MSLAEDVLALLVRRAASGGGEPWIAAPVGLDWRWWSWEDGRAGIDRFRALLAPLDLRPGETVGLPAPAGPPTVAAAMAVALAGGVPAGASDLPAIRLDIEGWTAPATAACRVEIAAARPAAGPRSSPAPEPERGWPRAMRTARRGRDRPVMVWAGLPWSPPDLERVAWSVESEAALLIEPSPAAFPASVLWARPTHLLESGVTLDDLAVRLLALSGGRDPEPPVRRRLTRLTAVWWSGKPPAPASVELFTRLGARVEPWPFGAA